jgi:hypothetical protein
LGAEFLEVPAKDCLSFECLSRLYLVQENLMNSVNETARPPGWRLLVRLSWWMLPTFAAWTVLFIFASEPILSTVFGFTPSIPGETFYIKEWGPWIAVTMVWLVPVLIGLASSAIALRRGAGKAAWVPFVVHLTMFGFVTVPNIIERILFL